MSEYIVEIDGRRVGRLRSGASTVYEVTPGHHEVRVRFDTVMAPKMGYAGSPTFEANVREGQSVALDVETVPSASRQILFGQQMTDDPEGWLLLSPVGADKRPRSRQPLTAGHWLRYTLGILLVASMIATSFVFRTGTAAWWASDTVGLISGATIIYLLFGGRRRA